MPPSPTTRPRATRKLVYPPVAQQLLDGTAMTDAPLTAEQRIDVADDIRNLRNAIAASYGRDTVAQHPGTARDERSSAFGQGHDHADRLLLGWFREHPDGARPGLLRPDFTDAHNALIAVTYPRDRDGHQRSRYERVSRKRLRLHSIPEDFFTLHDTRTARAQLDRLAIMTGLPPGYLLVQFRTEKVLHGREWRSAPVHPWLRDAIGRALIELGVEPVGPLTLPIDQAQTSPGLPATPPARPGSLRDLSPARLAAVHAVQRLQAAQQRVGTIEQFFQLFGGRQGFEAHFGHTSIQRRNGTEERRANFPWVKMQGFLRTDLRGMSAAQLNRTTLLPGPQTTERIESVLHHVEPLLPSDGAICNRGHRSMITRSLATEREQQGTLFGQEVGTQAGGLVP